MVLSISSIALITCVTLRPQGQSHWQALRGQAILRPLGRPIADVYAFAKRDLNKGDTVVHGIGGDEVYGLIDHVKVGEAERLLPIWLFEGESDKTPTLIINEVAKDAPVTLADISIPDNGYPQALERAVRPA